MLSSSFPLAVCLTRGNVQASRPLSQLIAASQLVAPSPSPAASTALRESQRASRFHPCRLTHARSVLCVTVRHSLLCLALRNHEAPKTERSVAARLEGVPTANRGQSAALKAPGIPEAAFSMRFPRER